MQFFILLLLIITIIAAAPPPSSQYDARSVGAMPCYLGCCKFIDTFFPIYSFFLHIDICLFYEHKFLFHNVYTCIYSRDTM
jgi:hypothetical protein